MLPPAQRPHQEVYPGELPQQGHPVLHGTWQGGRSSEIQLWRYEQGRLGGHGYQCRVPRLRVCPFLFPRCVHVSRIYTSDRDLGHSADPEEIEALERFLHKTLPAEGDGQTSAGL